MKFKRLFVLALLPMLLIVYYRILEILIVWLFPNSTRGDTVFLTVLTICFSVLGAAFYGLVEETRDKP